MFELCGIRITEVLLACEGVREIQIVWSRVKSSRRFSMGPLLVSRIEADNRFH